MAFTEGITKCYKLYSITVLCIWKAAYTLFMGKFTTFPTHVLLKTISIAVLLSVGMTGWAQARPDRGDRDAGRGEYRSRDFGQSGRQGQNDQGADNSRKQQSRMTPEQRRALRRQINEAG